MKFRLFALVVVIVSVGFLAQAEQQTVRILKVVDFKTELEGNEFLGTDYAILDVRTKLEFNNEHIEDAISIPRAEIEVRHNELNHLYESILYVYGSNTYDAKRASQFLDDTKIFTDIVYLESGIEAWRSAHYILVK